MKGKSEDYGLVVCGGSSQRMGEDKSQIIYHDKPQRYHLYEMLQGLCTKTFICCNDQQAPGIDGSYDHFTDALSFHDTGPMAGLLTAGQVFPNKNFFVVGCDYPFLSVEELSRFIESEKGSAKAAAFFNVETQLFEPLLGWYSSSCIGSILKQHKEGNFSLQHYLKISSATKYYPLDPNVLRSIDTQEAMKGARLALKTKLVDYATD